MTITPKTLDTLATFDSPTICNVVELFDIRPRNTGYMDHRVQCNFPDFKPMVGFATTACFRSDAPRDRAQELGYHLSGEQLQEVFIEFKKLADKKKEIYDGDIHALIQQEILGEVEGAWQLVEFQVHSASGETPCCKLTLSKDEEEFSQEVTDGDGPIDAAFLAVEKITGLEITCKNYRVRSATLGRDAIGEVFVEIEHDGKSYRGRGTSTDTVESTIQAILDAVNRIVAQGSV